MKKTQNVPRPNSLEYRAKMRENLPNKVIVALEVVDQISSMTQGIPIFGEEGEVELVVRELRPKEEACYSAALHFLETYLDAHD